MAELTDELAPDTVTCRCGTQWDRNVFSQCAECSADLWNPDHLAPRTSDPATVIEEAPQGARGLDVLACGQRIRLEPGSPVRLGRQEECETAAVFRGTANVSRWHAVLRFDGQRLFVTDTKSSNGTFVNDMELPADTEYELRPGQTLRLASNVNIDVKWES